MESQAAQVEEHAIGRIGQEPHATTEPLAGKVMSRVEDLHRIAANISEVACELESRLGPLLNSNLKSLGDSLRMVAPDGEGSLMIQLRELGGNLEVHLDHLRSLGEKLEL